jgi:hypothetical protein
MQCSDAIILILQIKNSHNSFSLSCSVVFLKDRIESSLAGEAEREEKRFFPLLLRNFS